MRIELAALYFALLLLASPAHAQNPCVATTADGDEVMLAGGESGIGGTGRGGGDESGIGGTGLSGSDESGIGGTGRSGGDESGIGGTGVFGTITGFGSICVNGLRVHYDENTPVSIDGQPSSTQAFAIGQVVAVFAAGEGEELQARRVFIHTLLTGPVTGIDREAGEIHVMGGRVLLPADAMEIASRLKTGSRVSLSGHRREDGSVIASRLLLASEGQPDRVAGLVRRGDAGAMQVGGIPVSGISGIEEGEFVRVTGSFETRHGRFAVKTLSTTTLIDPRAERLSVEGYLQEVPRTHRLVLPGIEIDRASLERVLDSPDRNERIRVTGRRDSAGRLRVERVQRVERPRGLRRPDRPNRRSKTGTAPPAIDKQDRPSTRVDKPAKPTKSRKDIDRPKRPPRSDRPRPPERPPRIDRPEKPDRPTAIDAIREIRANK